MHSFRTVFVRSQVVEYKKRKRIHRSTCNVEKKIKPKLVTEVKVFTTLFAVQSLVIGYASLEPCDRLSSKAF